MKHLHPLLVLLLVLGLLVTGCRKEAQFTDEAGIELDFSKDTVMFDTLFATVGSVTKRFVARNPHSNAVRVRIALEGGSPSPFRINVDGATGTSFADVEILGGDSIFIFVEATLDQNNQANPFVFEDHILFSTNGSVQNVLLVAWGRNAHFIKPDPGLYIPGLPPYSYIAGGYDQNGNQICETVTWGGDLPYVVYGYGVVDSCCTLIIEPGVNVYFHNGAGLWVYRHGQIKANGDVGQPITFQGDRLEPVYAEVPGQWDRIWLNEGPDGFTNEFSHVLIKNALVGIQCENVPWRPDEGTSTQKLVLNSVKIRNCSAAGILSRNYTIEASNLLVGDCGQYGVALTGGGNYTFEHFTIANYWNYEIRQTPAFYMNNVYADINNTLQVREVGGRFQNGIIHGSNANEFRLEFNDLLLPTALTIDHSMLRTDASISGSPYFPNPATVYRNQSVAFADAAGRDLHLESSSFARGRATPSYILPLFSPWDLDGVSRGESGAYDLGCYQYVE